MARLSEHAHCYDSGGEEKREMPETDSKQNLPCTTWDEKSQIKTNLAEKIIQVILLHTNTVNTCSIKRKNKNVVGSFKKKFKKMYFWS